MHILLTNDDSHTSPLFYLAIEYLHTLGDLTIVVPAEEQSWTGKSITRFTDLHVDEIRIRDDHAFCVNGTPADCVNIAVYNLLNRPPDLVVSGINIGVNAGLSFVLSSGTVGACLEANIAGISAIALSQDLDRETFFRWTGEQAFHSDIVDRLRLQNETLLHRVFEMLTGTEDHLADPITWNVNLPFHAAPDCRLVRTCLGHTYYRSCFKKVGVRYHHHIESVDLDRRPHADGMVFRGGHVSITRLDTRELGTQ